MDRLELSAPYVTTRETAVVPACDASPKDRPLLMQENTTRGGIDGAAETDGVGVTGVGVGPVEGGGDTAVGDCVDVGVLVVPWLLEEGEGVASVGSNPLGEAVGDGDGTVEIDVGVVESDGVGVAFEGVGVAFAGDG